MGAREQREQIEQVPRSLEETVTLNHPARAIWALLERLDLRAFSTRSRAEVEGPGRPASAIEESHVALHRTVRSPADSG